jgi:hypothetical protein
MACPKITSAGIVASDDNLYDSPIQGNQDDCALIAALSSVAWVTKKNKLKCTYSNPNYTATFYTSGTTNVTVSNDLDLQNAHSSVAEAWVGVYEKAYAKQFLGCGDPCCPFPSGLAWPGNASPVLQYLTGSGCSVTTVTSNLFSAITANAMNNKTKYPTVIWTKDPIPTGPTDDKALRKRHSYSVLGYSGNYAVLRDPRRALPDTAPANSPNCLLTGSYTFTNHFVVNMCPHSLTPKLTRFTVNYGSNGIVGVHMNRINDPNWFAGMCYVK